MGKITQVNFCRVKMLKELKENYESEAFKYEVRGKKHEVKTILFLFIGLK